MFLKGIVFCFCLIAPSLFAQYKTFIKLQALFEAGRFNECIDKSKQYLEKNQDELYPYFWQMRSFLAIQKSKPSDDKKVFLNKAIGVALKIKKKDQAEYFLKKYPEVYADLQIEGILETKRLCSTNFEKSESLFNKLLLIQTNSALIYSHYQCLKSNGLERAESILKELVDVNYYEFVDGQKSIENIEPYYATLASDYAYLGLYNKALTTCKMASVVYKKIPECEKAMMNFSEKLVSEYDYGTDINSLQTALIFIRGIDSMFSGDAIIKYQKRLHFLIANRSLFLAQKNKNPEVLMAIKEYVNGIENNKFDSSSVFFVNYLYRSSGLGKDERWRVFDYWTEICRFYQRNSLFESARLINADLQNKMELGLAGAYLKYCAETFHNDRTVLNSMQRALDEKLTKEIQLGRYRPENDIFYQPSDHPKLKALQLQKDIQKLNGYLEQKQYNLFASLLIVNLRLYPGNDQLLELKKRYVIEDYRHEIIESKNLQASAYFDQIPSIELCKAGIPSKLATDLVLRRLNYIRRLAGITDTCTFSLELNRSCQAAALMMDANGMLNHYPAVSWKCYSKEGAMAAGSSNLSLGYGFEQALMGQVDDYGSGNFSCGHRRWILNPQNRIYGFGSTQNAMCLKVFGYGGKQTANAITFVDSQYVSWPSADFFPIRLLPNRWSFSLKGADFSKSKVIVTANGKVCKVLLEELSQGYGLNTIVWTISEQILVDIVYKVTILKVETANNNYRNYSYQTTFLKIE